MIAMVTYILCKSAIRNYLVAARDLFTCSRRITSSFTVSHPSTQDFTGAIHMKFTIMHLLFKVDARSLCHNLLRRPVENT